MDQYDAGGGELFVEKAGGPIRAVNGTMLTAGAAESNLQGGKAALQEAACVVRDKGLRVLQEGKDLTVLLQETDDGLVAAGKLFILLVLAGIVRSAAVENVSASVAGRVLRDAFFEGKTIDAYR